MRENALQEGWKQRTHTKRTGRRQKRRGKGMHKCTRNYRNRSWSAGRPPGVHSSLLSLFSDRLRLAHCMRNDARRGRAPGGGACRECGTERNPTGKTTQKRSRTSGMSISVTARPMAPVVPKRAQMYAKRAYCPLCTQFTSKLRGESMYTTSACENNCP